MKLSFKTICNVICLVAGFLLATGCETTPRTVDAATLTKISRVGVVSAAGDRLFHHHVGFMVFGNKNESHEILDWGLDNAWESKIAQAASALGSVQVVKIDTDRTSLFASYPLEDTWPRQWRTLDFKKAAPEFRRIAEQNNVDALIVLGSGGYDTQRASVVLEGVSIFSDGGLAKNAFYWLVTDLYLVDGSTGMPLASRRVGKDDIFGPNPIAEQAPEELRAKLFSEYTDDERAFLRDRYAALGDPYWANAVAKLLTPRE